jgi:5-methyltetrahydropteroyltriglutamate--homocysteine methyltransferase
MSTANTVAASGHAPSTIARADVVGSLLRPPALLRAREQWEAGTLSRAELDAASDAAVREVIALQRECGLEVVTDGEMRRDTYHAPLTEGLEGVALVEGRYKTWRDAQGNEQRVPHRRAVVGTLALRESVAADEYRFARTVADVPVKVTLPSPLSLLSSWTPDDSAQAYPDPTELFADSARILGDVIAELVDLGCRYIQFDAPELTAVVDPDTRAGLAARGLSDLLVTGCRLMNDLADVGRDDVRFAIHLCRGNNRGLFLKSGGYEQMVAALYEHTSNISTLMLEFDDDRSGGFEPLEGVPDDKILVLGLVSTKTGHLEDPGAVMERIEQAARYVPLDQLALSTQCGFSSTAAGNPITESEQRQKLSLVADIAGRVWG